MPCVKDVLLADRDTDILVASKGTEMTSSPFEVEVELDRLPEPDLMTKKEETHKVRYIERYSTKKTAKDVSGNKSEGISQTDKPEGQVRKAEVW